VSKQAGTGPLRYGAGMDAMRRHVLAPVALGLAVVAAAAGAACADDGDDEDAAVPSGTTVERTAVPGLDARATLRGRLTLDGAPLVSEFLGARVIRDDGLVAACQAAIPAVIDGEYSIPVSADVEVRGCGAPGAEVLLWAYVGDTYVYSNETVEWPGDGGSATFDATFSSAAPEGASTRVTEVKGLLYERDGTTPLPGGTVVEAYIADTRCGITSLRYADVTEGYYTLIIAGPDTLRTCSELATVTFRLNGEPVVETAVNDLGGGSRGHEINLTLR